MLRIGSGIVGVVVDVVATATGSGTVFGGGVGVVFD